jgi:NAD(P)-dependent dehydrogenase (short-subunit alcohol dehydrogenase family)
MLDLAGTHVVITGAAGFLGSALADRAIDLGARLTLVDMTLPNGQPSNSKGEVRWLRADLSNRQSALDALSGIGPVDGLFHLAGAFEMGADVDQLSVASIERMFTVNVTTLLNAAHALVPLLRTRGGAIVTIGALSALKGQGGQGAYCAAKSSVMRLTESLSAELRSSGINVNCVLPSIIDTPANRRDMPDANHSAWVSTRQLSDVICFLGSRAANGIHGALIPVANHA